MEDLAALEDRIFVGDVVKNEHSISNPSHMYIITYVGYKYCHSAWVDIDGNIREGIIEKKLIGDRFKRLGNIHMAHVEMPKRKLKDGSFGDRLYKIRDKKGMSRPELASRSGLCVSTITEYENSSREPSLYSAERIADALGVSIDYLAGRVKHGE